MKNLEDKIILINKPIDWTSNDVVQFIKHKEHYKKIGHAGTLDPKATGLLILGTNNKTKELTSLLHQDKTYELNMKFHFSSESFDLDTKIVHCYWNERKIIMKDIENAINYFINLNPYLQTPPKYSAIKINGHKAYELARKNKEFIINPKEVKLLKVQLLSFDDTKQELRLLIDCSSGFYVRSFVNDIANFLEVHAILIALKRTRIGSFLLTEAKNIDK